MSGQNLAVPKKKAVASKSIDKSADSPELSQSGAASSAGAEKKPYVEKKVGGSIFDKKIVPIDFIEAAKSRFGKPGVAIDFRVARENGDYRGEVLAGERFIAQQVGAGSVVLHQKSDITFASNTLKFRDENNTLNRANLGVFYNGDKATAYPHDPERENLAKLIGSIKKSAERLNIPDLETFKKNIEAVHTELWQQRTKDRRADKTPGKSGAEQEQSR